MILRASRSRFLAEQFRRRAFARRAVRRFMPGEDVSAALEASVEFTKLGIGTVLTNLGERVTTRAEATGVRDHYLGVLNAVRERGLPAQISVKLTHLGLNVDQTHCADHVLALAEHASVDGSTVWLDMEESQYTDATLTIFRQVRERHSNIGVCLQAYLRRTAADLAALMPLDPAIRLVKGAYNEPREIAFSEKRDVDENFFSIATQLLSLAGDRQVVPVFGTHDMGLIGRIRHHAGTAGIPRSNYEFHMLYGIRSNEQRSLALDGCTVSVLISYGTAWFPWYMRRLAERPANVWFVVRNLF
ncbi:MAG: proline dehydrogenase family protein [Gemmatimonadaceae bacterium]